jgi:glycosyltransferase involved in cell wall biosynthesis
MDLSVVIPCWNEEGALSRLHDALVAALPSVTASYEVILVDDGSTDRTLPKARMLAASNPRFRYVSLSRNFGKESAILAGLRRARGRRVAIMDADLQHPPNLLKQMFPLMDRGYDQVIACRSREGERCWRALMAKLYYWAISNLSAVSVRDGVGDFRLLSRRAVEALLSLPERNRFSKGMFEWIGYDTVSISYRNVRRNVGRSKWSLVALMNYGLGGLISFNAKPLRLSLYLGVLGTVLTLAYLASMIIGTLVRGTAISGYATLLMGVLGFGGLHLLFLGLIGEYLERIYAESKQRPHFLVKEQSAPAFVRPAVSLSAPPRCIAADP